MRDFLNLNPIAFGLDISDLSLKIVCFQRASGRRPDLKLVSFLEKEISPGLISRGEIKDEAVAAQIIHQAALDLIKLPAVISLPEEKAFLRVIQLPKMTEKELAVAVPLEAENYLPLSPKDCYLDFEVVPPFVNHLDHLDVLLAAVPRNTVDQYLRVLKMAGLSPLAFEIESLAVSRALIKNNVSSQTVLLVDLGATRTGLVVFSGTSVRFTTSLEISSSQLTQDLASGLKVALAEAEKIKVNYGLQAQTKVRLKERTGDLNLDREVLEDGRISQILYPTLSRLMGEIKSYLNFYVSHSGHEHLLADGLQIRKILLAGGGAKLKGLDQFFSQGLGIETQVADPWINALIDPQAKIPGRFFPRSLSFTVAIGLALRGAMVEEES
jgi:type IV pilus assembly protein PilM